MPIDLKSRPNLLPWPPIIFIAAVVAGLALQYFYPWSLGFGPPRRVLGVAMIALGLGLDVWAIRTMRRAETNIFPNRAADKLVDYGPFAISRNPIYLGSTLVVLGIAGALDSGWFVLAAVACAGLNYMLAIRREETHMALTFGPAWERYAKRTPRWIGLGSFRPGDGPARKA